jgi:hypothetical protein
MSSPNDKGLLYISKKSQKALSEDTIKRPEDDEAFVSTSFSVTKVHFLIFGKVNRKYFRNWGTQQPYVTLQVVRESRFQFWASCRVVAKVKQAFPWHLQVGAPFLVHAVMQLR